jgi:hypothetical protein
MKNTAKAPEPQGANQAQDASKSDSRFWQITMTFQQIMRDFAHEFTPSQLAVLFFVMDRTVGWGKRWEIITQRQFLNGIPSSDEDAMPHAGRLKMALNTLKSALSFLLESGIIVQRKVKIRNGTYTAYALNDKFFTDLPAEKKTKPKKAEN